ncbi:orotidine-5'-phosphate decarboxylase [Patescibacteria group bacterium]|nr:orotidine-5'-phosphate decarboxylase [Patescibacteria group bacterium]
MRSNFFNLLGGRWKNDRFICVGLDSDPAKIPAHITGSVYERILAFNQAIIDATVSVAGAFKPQAAVYEGQGEEGTRALRDTVRYIKRHYPDLPVILDAKRGDIGSTNQWYVQSIFDDLGFDAVTVQPYLGGVALEPFLAQKDKGIIVLCHTSNPGAGELQTLPVGESGQPLYQYVATQVAEQWNGNNNCALVMGATYPEPLTIVRKMLPEMVFLIPGIGAQGGNLEATVKAARTATGEGMIINSSRGIIFASSGLDFAEAAAAEAKKLNQQINQYRHER